MQSSKPDSHTVPRPTGAFIVRQIHIKSLSLALKTSISCYFIFSSSSFNLFFVGSSIIRVKVVCLAIRPQVWVSALPLTGSMTLGGCLTSLYLSLLSRRMGTMVQPNRPTVSSKYRAPDVCLPHGKDSPNLVIILLLKIMKYCVSQKVRLVFFHKMAWVVFSCP